VVSATARAPLTAGVLMMACSGLAVVGIGFRMYRVLKDVNQKVALWVPGPPDHRVRRLQRVPADPAAGRPEPRSVGLYPTGIGGLILSYLLFVSTDGSSAATPSALSSANHE
jgi:hypothetical protein